MDAYAARLVLQSTHPDLLPSFQFFHNDEGARTIFEHIWKLLDAASLGLLKAQVQLMEHGRVHKASFGEVKSFVPMPLPGPSHDVVDEIGD